MDQEIIDSLLPMKDPGERIAVIAPNGNQFDYFIKKLHTVSRVRVPIHCYLYIYRSNNLRGRPWSKVILLNRPVITEELHKELEWIKSRGIPVIEITDRDI